MLKRTIARQIALNLVDAEKLRIIKKASGGTVVFGETDCQIVKEALEQYADNQVETETSKPTPFWSPPGDICDYGCWVLIYGRYKYAATTMHGLTRMLVDEWEDDKHLVG